MLPVERVVGREEHDQRVGATVEEDRHEDALVAGRRRGARRSPRRTPREAVTAAAVDGEREPGRPRPGSCAATDRCRRARASPARSGSPRPASAIPCAAALRACARRSSPLRGHQVGGYCEQLADGVGDERRIRLLLPAVGTRERVAREVEQRALRLASDRRVAEQPSAPLTIASGSFGTFGPFFSLQRVRRQRVVGDEPATTEARRVEPARRRPSRPRSAG